MWKKTAEIQTCYMCACGVLQTCTDSCAIWTSALLWMSSVTGNVGYVRILDADADTHVSTRSIWMGLKSNLQDISFCIVITGWVNVLWNTMKNTKAAVDVVLFLQKIIDLQLTFSCIKAVQLQSLILLLTNICILVLCVHVCVCTEMLQIVINFT